MPRCISQSEPDRYLARRSRCQTSARLQQGWQQQHVARRVAECHLIREAITECKGEIKAVYKSENWLE
jgi:hypothetical protein